MAYTPNNSNGQTTSANSAPVVIASDQSAIPVSGTVAVVDSGINFSGSVSSATDLLVSTDVSLYTHCVFQLTGTWVGTVQALYSNDNINWYAGLVTTVGGTSTPPGIAVYANSIYVTPIEARYLRLSVTAYTSGTIGYTANINSGAWHTLNEVNTNSYQGGTWNITNVSGTVSLPTGAATSANQTTANSSLTTIANNTSNIPAKGAATTANSTPVNIASDQTVPVSATSLPLPTGAATNSGLTTINATLGSPMQNSGGTVAATQSGTWTVQPGNTANTTPWLTTLSQGGNNATVNSNGSITVGGVSAVGVAPVNPPVGVSGVDAGGLKRTFLTDTSGRLEIDTAQSLPLPTGASTSALQTTGNTSLSTIVTNTSNIPAVGQTTMSGSTPVTIASNQSAVSVTDTRLPTSLGTQASSTSLPVVLSNDQAGIPVTTSPSIVVATPTTNSMAALNATVVYQVQASGSYYLTLTNGPGATTAWSGTITFQYSTNGGSSYSSLTVSPVASPANSTNTTTSTANGLYVVEVPAGVGSQTVYIQAKMTSYTSGTAYFFVAPQQPQQKILIPWTYTVTSGQTLVGPIEASNLSELDVQLSAITTTVFTAQGTNDPTLATWVSLPVQDLALVSSAGALTITAASTYRIQPNGAKWIRIQCTTTGTVATVQGIAATVGSSQNFTSYGGSTYVSSIGTLPTLTNVTTVATVTTVSTVTNGNLGFPGAITDTASAAILVTTTSGPYTPTYGSSYQLTCNVTAVSGTTPTMDIAIQESRDSGTNYVTIYQFPRITTTGSYTSPLMPLTGNRLQYVQTLGGTSPSFTRTNIRMQSSATQPQPIRQIVDRSVTLTSLNSTTASLISEQSGNNITLTINVGAITTTAPALQIQASDDAGATWYNLGSPLTAVASSTVSATVTGTSAQRYQAVVTTAGVGVTAGYVLLRSF